ncbi:MAG TPA: hypothetical protein VMT17_04270 [Anaeromyxobacteraceae bacterium]|nr:hypothetical protein [Anaeromyxobacteraceae bacterium]
MKRLYAVAATAALLCCGKSSSGPVYDGGIVGTPPAGQAGFSFAPADGAALFVGPATCTQEGVTAQFTGLFLGFSGYSNVCGFMRTHGAQCADVGKASTTFVGVVILKGALGSVSAIGPGTYDVGEVTGTTEVTATGATVTVNDAACTNGGPDPSTNPVGGTLTITSASAGDVKGTVDLTWTGGGFSGPFEVIGCTTSVDVCGMLAGTAGCAGCF